jgi:hypothetical protein
MDASIEIENNEAAWPSVATLRAAGAKPDTITACSGWLAMTGGDVRRLREMPDKAQRRISQTLLVLQAAQYEQDTVKPLHFPDRDTFKSGTI